jgi:hypothetical protein
MSEMSREEELLVIIERRRRQLLVHSCIYYHMDRNLISDKQWDMWAYELAELQATYLELAKKGVFAEAFEGFDGTTGFDLPITDPWVVRKATYLLSISKGKPKNLKKGENT